MPMNATKKVALACTLVAALSLGSVGAAFASAGTPAPATLTITTAAQASISDANAVAATKLNAAARTALTKAIADLEAKVKAGKSDAELAAARADLLTKLDAAKASSAVYLAALNDLTQTFSTYNPSALPAWLTTNLNNAKTALKAAVAAGASDADVKALTAKVETLHTLIKDWRPASAQAGNAIKDTSTLVTENKAPNATAEALAAVTKAQAAVQQAVAKPNVTAAELNTAVADARTAVDAAKKSSADRAAAVTAANTALQATTILVKKYTLDIAPETVNQWKTAHASLTAGVKTLTPAQLNVLTKTLNDKAGLVTRAGAAIDGAKKAAADAAVQVKAHPKATAAQKAAVTKAVAAVNAGIKAKWSPEKLAPVVKALHDLVGKLAK